MIYLLYGDNSKILYYDNLLNSIKEKNENYSLRYLTEDVEINDFLNDILSTNLFGNHQIFVINHFENFKNKNKIIDFLKNINIENVTENKSLIILCDILSNDKNSNIIKEILNIKNINHHEFNDVTNSIKNLIKEKLNIDKISINKLCDIFNNDVYRAKNELEKLSLIFEDNKITFDDVFPFIYIDENSNNFEIVNNILNKNFKEMDVLEPLTIINILYNEILTIYYLHLFNFKGSYNDFNKFYTDDIKIIFNNQHPYTIYKKLEFIKVYNRIKCETILYKLFELEKGIKSGVYDINISNTLLKEILLN